MDPQLAIDSGRDAIRACLMVGGPILLGLMLFGLLVSVFQAATQLHDQTIAFVPKILLLLGMLALCLPWLSERMLDFAATSFSETNLVLHPTSTASSQSTGAVTTASPQPSISRVAYQDPFWSQAVRGSKAEPNSETTAYPDRGETPESGQPIEPRPASPFSLPHYESTPKARSSDLEG